ncbi:MAG: hypothetical protein NZ920_01415 [Aigarchaeota archaeon]|nr:hypothetical protein [Aigarchaeota archaeon]MDW8093100.1 hypothetical protein [Nitrososphaerota archaeon]
MDRLTKNCAICGVEVAPSESVASRYACLVTCLPLVRPDHLTRAHPEYLREAKLISRSVVYPAIGSAVIAVVSLIVQGSVLLAISSAALSISLLGLGSCLRVWLVRRHRRRFRRGP